MKNVHEFDRKIRIQTEEAPIEENVFEEFLEKVSLHPSALFMARDIIGNSEKNRDDINRADARQLLYTLLVKINGLKDEEDKKMFYLLLEEQLKDMKQLGPCAQGRTIRLWQLIRSLN